MLPHQPVPPHGGGTVSQDSSVFGRPMSLKSCKLFANPTRTHKFTMPSSSTYLCRQDPHQDPSFHKSTMNDPTEALLTIQETIDDASAKQLPLLYERRREVVMHIRHFWLTALLSHPAFSLLITAADAQLLRYLADIDITTHDRGFELSFTFATNKYFSNHTLTKRYTHTDAGRTIHPPKVAWLPPHKPARTGFFHWLTDSRDSTHLGQLIQEHVFPHAIELYFGTYDA